MKRGTKTFQKNTLDCVITYKINFYLFIAINKIYNKKWKEEWRHSSAKTPAMRTESSDTGTTTV